MISEWTALELPPWTSESQNLASTSSLRVPQAKLVYFLNQLSFRAFEAIVNRDGALNRSGRQDSEGFLPQIDGRICDPAAGALFCNAACSPCKYWVIYLTFRAARLPAGRPQI